MLRGCVTDLEFYSSNQLNKLTLHNYLRSNKFKFDAIRSNLVALVKMVSFIDNVQLSFINCINA
jgi:hypothetical protein